MVMPLRDMHPTRIVPIVNYLIIAACILMFLVQASQPEEFTVSYAATPYEITRNEDLAEPIALEFDAEVIDQQGQVRLTRQTELIPQRSVPFPVWFTLITSIFMHGGFLHLAGNMLYLWIFGDNVEEVLGHWKYMLVYLVCGLAASFSQILINPGSIIPTLGASGAIAGVMGMYLVWFPNNQVQVLVFRFITVMPAVLVIGLWLLFQLVLGMGELNTAGESGGVAYAAHIGGALAGIFLGLLFRNQARQGHERPSHIGWASRSLRDRY